MPIDRRSPKGKILNRGKQAFGAAHRTLYRWSGGRIGGTMRGVPTLLLTTRGRKSGLLRTVPLVYDEQEGSFVVAASNAGHWEPAWLLNLRADPQVRIEDGRRRFDAVARIARGEEGVALWAGYELLHPTYAAYPVKRGGIEIPMVVLTPREG